MSGRGRQLETQNKMGKSKLGVTREREQREQSRERVEGRMADELCSSQRSNHMS